MKVFGSVRRASGIALGAALLASCSANGSTPSLDGSSAAPQSAHGRSFQDLNRLFAMSNARHQGLPAMQHPLTHSWMHKAPPGTTGILWATNLEYATVDLIAYPSGELRGQVSGFSYPYGDCSDKHGNVYVADFSLEKGFAISPSGSVIASWSTGGETIGCSVNKAGDVAFTNFYPGGVVVFPAGGGSGTTYAGPGYDWPAGYDVNGSLYVECNYLAPCSSPSLYELHNGWTKLNFNQSINFPAAVQNYGKVLGVADQDYGFADTTGIWLTKVSAGNASASKAINMQGNGCSTYMDDSSSWAEIGKKPNGIGPKKIKGLAAANLWCFPSPINLYNKNGGDPIGAFTPVYDQYDYGVTFTSTK